MNKNIVIFLAAAALTFGLFSMLDKKQEQSIPASVVHAYTLWCNQHQKVRSSLAENAYRLNVFYKNVLEIESHNKAGHSWTKALNQFADLTHEEFISLFVKDKSTMGELIKMPESVSDPATLGQQAGCDKRNLLYRQYMQQDYVCNNAYAHVAATTMNTNYYASRGRSIPDMFSAQTYIDCSGNFGNGGCAGGLPSNCYDYSKNWGITSETDYPNFSIQNPCRSSTGYFKNSNVQRINSNTELFSRLCGANRVISTSLDLSQAQFYSGGIFGGPCYVNQNFHVVLLGAGTDIGTNIDYWALLSTFGTGWGEQGKMRIRRFKVDNDPSYSSCGLSLYASYPTF